jgi:hypothetical protein
MIYILKFDGYVAIALLLGPFGNWVIREFLERSGIRKVPSNKPNLLVTPPGSPASGTAGRYIGLLERFIVVTGLMISQWGVIAGVVALKSVSRYKELDTQITAEYFLVGSLASFVWALMIAGLLSLYDGTLGFHIFSTQISNPDVNPLLHYVRGITSPA